MGSLYDTDLSDAAWALVAPHLPSARPGGRPRTTDLRAVVNAVLYLLRTGCQWRLLPHDFPPWLRATSTNDREPWHSGRPHRSPCGHPTKPARRLLL